MVDLKSLGNLAGTVANIWSSAKGIVETTKFISEVFSGTSKEKKAEQNALLRSLYFEVLSNKLVLETIVRVDPGKSFDAVRTVAPLLKNDIGKAILYGAGTAGLKEIKIVGDAGADLAKETDSGDFLEDENATGTGYEKPQDFYATLKHSVDRIEAFKKLSEIPEDKESYFKKIRYNTRVETIRTYSRLIEKTLYARIDEE